MSEILVQNKKEDEQKPRRRPKKLAIPRRAPSVVTPPRQIKYITADKTTCKTCTCFPAESPYIKNKKLIECLISPLTLYELAAEKVDALKYPEALDWSVDDVARWMAYDVGLPQYEDCIRDNHINGMRLLRLEDPSVMPEINIKDAAHVMAITSQIHHLYSTEFIKFSRSISLPPRKPLTHCTWFHSRTGPSWGIRQNWTRSDVLRWMKILMPAPVHWDHWDLVWYHKPDFPRVKFARLPKHVSENYIPMYKYVKEICYEYLTPRKFRIQCGISESKQLIWMERQRSPVKDQVVVAKPKKVEPPPKVTLEGLKGDDLVLARRKMPKMKFFL